ncbi:MAG: hypothetical protein L3J47_00830 [Sulfurovum sp.]|nr:hypothetical protein [Sulfurovum sp.]
MGTKETKNTSSSTDTKKSGRRDFLKKVAYSAPVLIVMGQLAKPEKVHADGTGGPGGPPDWAGGWGQ